MIGAGREYDTAEGRWSGVGPYYAMFPVGFANTVVRRYTRPGDTVLDPFAGRGTSVFSAATQGRTGIGIELNPVGWVYARTKLKPAGEDAVVERFKELGRLAFRYRRSAQKLPPFFHHCYSPRVQEFLLAARHRLDWKARVTDCTTMTFLLVYLHGKQAAALSNQMRQTKSLSPDYAIRWWQDHELRPPDIDPVEFMLKRVAWRYAKGRPSFPWSRVYLGDCLEHLPRLSRCLRSLDAGPTRLLFTSPPYFGLTHYHYDQWLRLWLLGGPPNAYKQGGKYRGRFENRDEYHELLFRAFSLSRKLLVDDSTVFVRTSKQKFTYETTLSVVRSVFPEKALMLKMQPFQGPTQTHLFGDRSEKEGEVDIVLFNR